MKKINRFNSLLAAICIAAGMAFTACESENITTETYDFPDVYVALIKVSPTVAIPLSDLTIEGNDFDHVKAVRLWNDESSLEIPKANFKSSNNTTIVITVPENAPIGKISVITNENKVITWLNGMTDKQIAITDVAPVVVAWRDTITVSGENLDLVKTVLFRQGENSLGVSRENFVEASAESIVLVVPDNAPINQIVFISDYDQMIIWGNTLTERVITVSDLEPAAGSIVVLGTTIIAIADNLDLLQSVRFGTYTAGYTVTDGNILTVTIPAIPVGQYDLKLITKRNEVVAGRYQLVSLNFEPTWDKSHIYFDFDGKDGWWGDCPQLIENDAEYAISGSYFHAKATASAGWYGLFWRNNGNGLNTSGVNVTDWVVKYDVNVLGSTINSIKIRLGNFWYVTEIMPNIGGWYTISAPLNEFKDNDGNGRAMTNADVAVWATSGDFGLADGGQGGEYDALFDNIRLESKAPYTDPVTDPGYVYFDFDGKDSWWGDAPQTVENDAQYAISGSYFHVKATVSGSWYGFFWRNAGNGLNVSGLTVEDWVVKYDINVLGDAIKSIKIRLGDFWYVTTSNPNLGGWYTFSAPLSGFKDNDGKGRAMTDADVAALASNGDFGMADGGQGGVYDVLIDNVRFDRK